MDEVGEWNVNGQNQAAASGWKISVVLLPFLGLRMAPFMGKSGGRMISLTLYGVIDVCTLGLFLSLDCFFDLSAECPAMVQYHPRPAVSGPS